MTSSTEFAVSVGSAGTVVLKPPDSPSIVIRSEENKLVLEQCNDLTMDLKKCFWAKLCLGLFPNNVAAPKLLVFVTQATNVGRVGGHDVFRVDETRIINVGPNQDKQQDAWARDYLSMVLRIPSLYFGQSIAYRVQESFESVDSRDEFMFNAFLMQNLFSLAPSDSSLAILRRMTRPVVLGAVFCHVVCPLPSDAELVWSVVSRRSRRRVGTRFFVRGTDKHGNAANFVETEQILEACNQNDKGQKHTQALLSFVQTRGSIPFSWSQRPDLTLRPKPAPGSNVDEDASLLKLHFENQLKFYGNQMWVNLINQKGSEHVLGRRFAQLVDSSSELQYKAYDFHHECRNMRYDRLHELVHALKPFLDSQESFHIRVDTTKEENVDNLGKEKFAKVSEQRGVVRTNCIDCLDRTNVLQSLLAEQHLLRSLPLLGLEAKRLIETKLSKLFKETWADHANMISVQYASTGALKTDFTRTGKRTYVGLIQDGWNALLRFYFNNFQDGKRTDALRLFVGEADFEDFVAKKKQHLRLQQERKKLRILPFLALFLLTLLITLLAFLPRVDAFWSTTLALTVGGLAMAVSLAREQRESIIDQPLTL